jgi:hypothetical protein
MTLAYLQSGLSSKYLLKTKNYFQLWWKRTRENVPFYLQC